MFRCLHEATVLGTGILKRTGQINVRFLVPPVCDLLCSLIFSPLCSSSLGFIGCDQPPIPGSLGRTTFPQRAPLLAGCLCSNPGEEESWSCLAPPFLGRNHRSEDAAIFTHHLCSEASPGMRTGCVITHGPTRIKEDGKV